MFKPDLIYDVVNYAWNFILNLFAQENSCEFIGMLPSPIITKISFLDDSSYAAVYLYTQLQAEKPTKAYFILSVTDGAKIYLNENLIAAHYGYNYYNEGKIISCDLKNGDNSVVVKTINKDWDWKIKLKILDKERGQIVLNKR